MRLAEDGRLLVPRWIRERLGLDADTELELEVHGDELRIRRAAPTAKGRDLEQRRRLARTTVLLDRMALAMRLSGSPATLDDEPRLAAALQ